jgi:transcriptional regulator with XRE-family HTH domain
MAHEPLNFHVTREWAREQAGIEPDDGITSVGGLAHRIGALEPTRAPGREAVVRPSGAPPVWRDPRRHSLGKLVELSRRRLRLSIEQLAAQADVDVAELLALERAGDVVPQTRTVRQVAGVLRVPVEPLLELAGLAPAESASLTESAVRFAARSESINDLSKEEEEALSWFVQELAKA